MNILAVFIGGGIGAVLRYLAGLLCGFRLHHMPIATFSVNIIACFIIGMCFAIFQSKTDIPPSVKLALTCGFCGGLSTLSALALEFLLIQETYPITAIFYTIGTLILCVLATAFGMWVGKFF